MIEAPLDSRYKLSAITGELIDARLLAGSTIRFTVPTVSMSPILLPGDHVIVRALNPVDLRLGDILVVKQQGAWIAHRLIGRGIKGGSLFLLLKGDNSAEPDSPYTAAALFGVVETVDHAGHAYSLRSNRAVWFGRGIASLSGLEASLSHIRPYLLRRVLLKGTRLLLQGLANLGKRVIL